LGPVEHFYYSSPNQLLCAFALSFVIQGTVMLFQADPLYLSRSLALVDGDKWQGPERRVVATGRRIVEVGRFTSGRFVTAH
jgi:hypothetical protein